MNNSNKSNFIVHLIYASSFLLAVLVFVGYMVWDKHKVAMQAQLAEDRRVAQEKVRKANVALCMVTTSNIYSNEWAKACAERANDIKNSLNNCINEAASFAKYMKTSYTTASETRNLYNLKVAQCKSIYDNSKHTNHDCALPAAIADTLNQDLHRAQKLCAETE